MVLRQRLTEKLNAGLDGKLILVSAPAGSGKTTLVAEWLDSLTDGVKFTWLSLDEGDNDPYRFIMYLIAALRQISTGIGKSVEPLIRSPQPPPGDVIITALVNEIAVIPQPFLLILDDFHVLHSAPIFQQMNFLLEHQPPQMHLVVVTREDPPLPLPRLRARGQMTEIRQNDLRFTLEECAEFLIHVMGLSLPPDDIASLERRTEGWIAGLQLAALSMRGRNDLSSFIEAFTGSSHFVLDYLVEEVFNHQPDDVRDFLLKTSVLERLCGPLCDAVAGRTDSRSLLEKLEHANLFIIPLDQACTWYRYHHLFADLLHQRLLNTKTIFEPELHVLASQWLENDGFLPEAIRHSLAARDWDRAARLIGEQSTAMMRRGELVTLIGWLRSLPEDVIKTKPSLCRDCGWALMLTGQLDSAAIYLDCAEQALQGDQNQIGQIMVAQAYLARVRGDYPRAIALSQKAMEFVTKNDVLHRGLVTFTLGFSLFGSGRIAEAEPVLLEASETARASGNDYTRQTALGLLGAIKKNQGKLRAAADYCQQALNEAHGSPTAAQVWVFLAAIFYEWNDLDAALDHLARAFKAVRQIGNVAILPEAHQIMTHIHLARGDNASALNQLNEFHELIQGMNSPPARAMVAALHAEVALSQGDVSSAGHWVSKMTEELHPSTFGTLYGLTKARLSLAEGKRAEAAKLFADVYDSGAQMGLTALMISVHGWQALAAEDPNEAIRFLQDALKMGQPESFIRTFVDKGEPMRLLLERMKSEGGKLKEYVLTLLSAFGEEKVGDSKKQPLVEAMSERELEILRLMADGLSNREIAERLVITVGTTKSHVHNVLEKLGCGSRTQAVAKARELGLL